MKCRIDTKTARAALEPRREPYFVRVAAGVYVGVRVLSDLTQTWIVRYRFADRQHYKSVGALLQVPHQQRFEYASEMARQFAGEFPGALDPVPAAAIALTSSKNGRVNGGPCNLYRHFDVDGRLLYVGISNSAIARLKEHQHGHSHWVDEIAHMTVETFPSREIALAMERWAIQREKPLHNIAHRVREDRP